LLALYVKICRVFFFNNYTELGYIKGHLSDGVRSIFSLLYSTKILYD